MKLYNSESTSSAVETKPQGCLSCRLVGAAGLIGIGGYLGVNAAKNKTNAGKYFVSFLSFGFICLGVARYRQTFPFNKGEEFQSRKK